MSEAANGGETPDDAGNGFDLQAALDNVREDTDLQPVEKETTIRFAKDTDTIRVFTAEKGLMRRFLAHPASSIHTLTVRDGDARPALPPSLYDGEEIVGLDVTLPIGALLFRRDPRQSGQHAEIVTERVFETVGEGDQ